MKKITLLLGLMSFLNLFISCDAGYVSEQPTYIETARPMSPGTNYIWIDGDWRWDNRTRSYNHGNGRWEMPNRGRSYNQGHWNNSPKGYRWEKGRRN